MLEVIVIAAVAILLLAMPMALLLALLWAGVRIATGSFPKGDKDDE